MYLKIFILLVVSEVCLGKNNVCPSLLDYTIMDINPKCYYNPNVGATTEEIVEREGYPFESHTVTTKDGYILTLHRIPYGKNYLGPNKRQPVFILHGIALTSSIFVSIPKKSLAFLLADEGYDVWLGNIRGSRYSLDNTEFSNNTKEYWDFSFHEVGVYDLPAALEYIKKKTEKKIVYIGFSMGTTVSYVYSILKKEHARRHLLGLISLAPVAYMTKTQGLAPWLSPFAQSVLDIAELLHIYELGDADQTRDVYWCRMFSLVEKCRFLVFSLLGFDYLQFEPEDIPIVFTNYISAASIKTVQHYAQIVKNGGDFRMYDYGYKENMKRYGSDDPPKYDLTQISLPVHLIYGKNDYLATETDAKLLYNVLYSPQSIYTPNNKKYNHLDFLYGKDNNNVLLPNVLSAVEDLSK